jgi:hypothetical protein
MHVTGVLCSTLLLACERQQVHVMCENLWFGTKVMYTPLFFWLQFVFCDYLGIYRTNNILQVDSP